MHNELGGKRITKRNIQGDVTGGRTDTGGGTSSGTTTTVNLAVYCMYVTLTNYDLNGTETVDGESPSNGDRILVANQTDASENGIYIYNSSGDWSRADGLLSGLQVSILGGTKQGTMWMVETPTFVVDTDDISIIESAISRKDESFSLGFDAVTSLMTSDIALFQVSSNEIQSGTVQDVLDLVPSGIDDGTSDNQSLRWDSSSGAWVKSDIIGISDGLTSEPGVLILPQSSNSSGVRIVQDGLGTSLSVDTNLGRGNTNLFVLSYDDTTVFNVIRSGETTIYDQLNLLDNHGVVFYEDNSNGYNYVKLIGASNIASNFTLTLPSADGTADQVMKTDGSGNLGWATPSSGEANTGTNVGGEKEVYKSMSGTALQFRTLKEGTGITLTENTNDIEISASGGDIACKITSDVSITGYDDYSADLGSVSLPVGTYTYSGCLILYSSDYQNRGLQCDVYNSGAGTLTTDGFWSLRGKTASSGTSIDTDRYKHVNGGTKITDVNISSGATTTFYGKLEVSGIAEVTSSDATLSIKIGKDNSDTSTVTIYKGSYINLKPQ